MKVLSPFYFDEFSCIGGKCPETCCAGWKIIIDSETYKKYQQVDGEFGRKLVNSISVNDKGENIFILNRENNEACPFLNTNLLCDIFLNIGEEQLCKTCKIYPRSMKKYGDIFEQDLTLSCPEVARILVNYDESIEFCFSECVEETYIEDEIDDEVLFNSLIAGRGLSVDLIQIKEIPIWKRLYLCLTIADKLQKCIDKNEINMIQKSLEHFYQDSYLIDYLQALEEFPDNNKLKLIQYESLLKIMQEIGFKNRTFSNYLNETVEFFSCHDSTYMLNFINEKMEAFNQFYKDKEHVYENYSVYHMFHYYMSSYKKRDPYKNIVMMIEWYSILKLFAVIRWFNNGYQFSEEEQCEIFYSYSRTIEHHEGCVDRIYDKIKELNFNGLAYVAILTR